MSAPHGAGSAPSNRRGRLPVVVLVVAVGLVGFGLAGERLVSWLMAPSSAEADISRPTPTPTPLATSTYAAVFAGDATGATDVTAALRTFLQSHNGQRVALATNGIYKVTQLSFTASGLTVDFRGARIEGAWWVPMGSSWSGQARTSSSTTRTSLALATHECRAERARPRWRRLWSPRGEARPGRSESIVLAHAFRSR